MFLVGLLKIIKCAISSHTFILVANCSRKQIALSRSHSARFQAATAPLKLAHSYLSFQLLSIRIQRDDALARDTFHRIDVRERDRPNSRPISQARKARRRSKAYAIIVKLYDGILQSLEQIRDLVIVEEDADLSQTVDACLSLIKARRYVVTWVSVFLSVYLTQPDRALFLSRLYALMVDFPAASALNAQSRRYLHQARTSLDIAPAEDRDLLIPLSSEDLRNLDEQIKSDNTRISLDWFAASPTYAVGEGEESLPDVGRLTVNDGVGGLAGPESKPIFFDIAYNYAVEFDLPAIHAQCGLSGGTMQGVIEEKRDFAKEPVKPRKGIWGFFGK
jgi:signal recognition particle subunit SRP68